MLEIETWVQLARTGHGSLIWEQLSWNWSWFIDLGAAIQTGHGPLTWVQLFRTGHGPLTLVLVAWNW